VESHANNRTLKEIDMSNLYVCNIPSSMNNAKLVELFLPFGKITHAMVVEQSNNSSKGFGFVKFADSHCAAEAVELMNGALIEGEMISVRVAGLSPSLSSSVSQHSPHSETNASPEINKCRLYVTNLPQSMSANKLVSLFMPFGQIDRVVIYAEYSIVLYADINSAAKALKHMDGYLIEGKRLVVKESEPLLANAAESACSQSGSKLVKEIDMANLYVGKVPSAVTCEQLVQIFCLYGEIVQAKKFDAGYGMIRYANASSAAAAIDHLDGYQIGGSTLVVRVTGLPAESDVATFARTPQTPGNEHRQIDMTNLYVGYLPPYVTTDKLIELFLPCGQITQAKVVVDKFTGVSKGFGFVRFADAYSAATAITHMNGYPLDGHMLAVRTAGVQ
jgi:polyadenylate-binding protein